MDVNICPIQADGGVHTTAVTTTNVVNK